MVLDSRDCLSRRTPLNMRTKPRAAGIKQLFSSSAVSRHCCGAMELHSWWVLVVLGAVTADAVGVEGVPVENTTEAAVHVSGEDVFVKVGSRNDTSVFVGYTRASNGNRLMT